MPARRRLATSAALAVVALLALVALASRSGTLGAGGSSTGPEPARGVLDLIFTFGVALVALVTAATLWTLRPSARFRQDRSFRLWPSLLATAIVIGAVALLATQLDGLDPRGERAPETSQTRGLPQVEPAPPSPRAEETPYRPRLRWTPLLVAAAIAAAVVAAIALRRSQQARRGTAGDTSESELVAELAATVDDAFAELDDEPDPRRAVIAAYARMERALAAHGLARRPFEAPLEYLSRIATSLASARRLVFELTHLYERARFSAHEIDGEMKSDAIATLAALRDELRPAA